MKVKRAALYGGSVWQILRFVLLVLFIFLALLPESDPRALLLFVWPAVAQLPLAVAFFFLGRDPARYGRYRPLLLLAKILDVAPGFLLLAYQAAAVFFGLGSPLFAVPPVLDIIPAAVTRSALFFHYSLVVVLLLDLILVLVLVSLPRTQDTDEPQERSALPEFSEVRLEDE